ncbi:MAG: hypothetical protein WA941_06060 [Nitrososphaeraceae archaeon]
MTNTVTESQIEGMLRRLTQNIELELSIDHNASGFTLLLMDGTRVQEMLGFSNSRRGIYDQLLYASRVIEAMHRSVLVRNE